MSVTLQHLSIGYRLRRGERRVADDICATIEPGQLTCLLGENGVGKSTLLRTLSAFQAPLAGDIVIDGRKLADFTDLELARTVGVVLTQRIDLQQMTVGELVAMGRSPYTGFWGRLADGDRACCDKAIRLVGIEQLAHRHVATLSDGERQNAMIAKALAQQTPVIYLDEPTAFLDYPSKVDMLLLLRRISRQQQKTIFLSTHDLELALQVADVVWLMERGGRLSIGTPAQLAAQGALTRFIERGDGIHFDADRLSVQVRFSD